LVSCFDHLQRRSAIGGHTNRTRPRRRVDRRRRAHEHGGARERVEAFTQQPVERADTVAKPEIAQAERPRRLRSA